MDRVDEFRFLHTKYEAPVCHLNGSAQQISREECPVGGRARTRENHLEEEPSLGASNR